MIALLMFAVVSAPQAQTPEVFVVETVPATEAAPARVTVSADQRQIDCFAALRALADAMTWRLDVESAPLRNDLQLASVDLSLARQNPRMVAQLIAVAGDADVIFDQRPGVAEPATTMHVVRQPSAETASGRRRLRDVAGQWYRSFLRAELEFAPSERSGGNGARMHLGELLVETGDIPSAIGFFRDVYESAPSEHLTPAVLKIAECHLDLAAGHADRAARLAEYHQAEQWVRHVFEYVPTSEENAAATILLGRALLGQARNEATAMRTRAVARECQRELRSRVIRLTDSMELLRVWILTGQAHFLTGRPARAYSTMKNLRESRYFNDLEPQHFLDYHFLLGFGALGVGEADLAMRSLEWFLIHGDEDDRRGQAYVMLAEAYMERGRYLEARAASVQARRRHLSSMTAAWRERTLKVWARTALALGDKEEAFLELEQLILRRDEPQLTLFLIDELLADRQWQRAMSVARVLTDRDDHDGDLARYKTVAALYEQSLAGGHLADFPPQAVAIAPKVMNESLRRKIATMIGEAYTKLEMLEHAADAFRGILR